MLMNVCAGLRVKLNALLSDNGPTELSVGVEKGAWARPDAWSRGEFCQQRPIIWFGTSIAEGGAAQRPGAQYLNMLTRQLGRVVINAAFAGPVSQWARWLLARLAVTQPSGDLTTRELVFRLLVDPLSLSCVRARART